MHVDIYQLYPVRLDHFPGVTVHILYTENGYVGGPVRIKWMLVATSTCILWAATRFAREPGACTYQTCPRFPYLQRLLDWKLMSVACTKLHRILAIIIKIKRFISWEIVQWTTYILCRCEKFTIIVQSDRKMSFFPKIVWLQHSQSWSTQSVSKRADMNMKVFWFTNSWHTARHTNFGSATCDEKVFVND